MQGKVPDRLGRRKTLTPFLRWLGPLVPTAWLNSSIGADWITPASAAEALDWGWILSQAAEIEARLRRYDGDYRWFLFRVEPVRDNHGNIFKWYGACTDIEDQERAEQY